MFSFSLSSPLPCRMNLGLSHPFIPVVEWIGNLFLNEQEVNSNSIWSTWLWIQLGFPLCVRQAFSLKFVSQVTDMFVYAFNCLLCDIYILSEIVFCHLDKRHESVFFIIQRSVSQCPYQAGEGAVGQVNLWYVPLLWSGRAQLLLTTIYLGRFLGLQQAITDTQQAQSSKGEHIYAALCYSH